MISLSPQTAAVTHGMSNHPAYGVWKSMRQRCNNPNNAAYSRYGGRGIVICCEWDSFEQFWSDMGPTYRRGLSIEREDNDAGYSKANCYWADAHAQTRNQRSNIFVDTRAGRMVAADVAQHFGIKPQTLYTRLSRGWTEAELLGPLHTTRPRNPHRDLRTGRLISKKEAGV